MTGLTLGSVCSGVGGLDLGLASHGVAPVWHAEVDPAAAAVLAARFPGVPNHGDITTLDWEAVEPVDVIAGGIPCQPFSIAGARAGVSDERWLWPAVADAVRVVRPRWVLLENVPGIFRAPGDPLGLILADLAGMGFAAEWGVFRAADVGAPHRRARFFLLAATDATSSGVAELAPVVGRQRSVVGTGTGAGHRTGGGGVAEGVSVVGRSAGPVQGADADTDRGEPERRRGPGDVGSPAAGPSRTAGQQRGGAPARAGGSTAPDTESKGRRRPGPADRPPGGGEDRRRAPQPRGFDSDAYAGCRCVDWGRYLPAVEHWERIVGRGVPHPTVAGARGGVNLAPELPEWMMGLPEGWITGTAGVSANAAKRLAGNAVVPHVAAAAWAVLAGRLRAEAET